MTEKSIFRLFASSSRSLLERIFIVNHDEEITSGHLPSDFLWHFREPSDVTDLAQIRKSAETKAILEVLSRVGGDRNRAAKILCISPRTLRHKLNQYDIKVNRRGEPQPRKPSAHLSEAMPLTSYSR